MLCSHLLHYICTYTAIAITLHQLASHTIVVAKVMAKRIKLDDVFGEFFVAIM